MIADAEMVDADLRRESENRTELLTGGGPGERRDCRKEPNADVTHRSIHLSRLPTSLRGLLLPCVLGRR
jgi:hypothetical protein